MYSPDYAREERPEVLRAMMREARLVLLVSNGPDGVADATHLPVTYDEADGPHGTLHAHFARANPHWRNLAACGRARVIFPGPEAYVSASLYPTRKLDGRALPTWNYVALHAIVAVEIIEEEARLRALVTALIERNEAPRDAPWRLEEADGGYVRHMLGGIVGVALRIEQLVGKRKLNQNRPAEDRASVARALAASEAPADRAVAAEMAR